MFDRTLLPPALLEFVVVADTHFMLETGEGAAEFSSRRKQTARAEVALRLAASLKPPLIVHLGDLVQEYPDAPAFSQAMEQARDQLRRCGVAPRLVAGNHDVGDKRDPTMPTRPVTPASLAAHHEKLGPSWGSFDLHDCHFVVLNSQIMNTPLPECARQQAWLEDDLQAHAGRRIFVFLHLPPYLWDEDEPSLGHYDNLAQPARTWLLDLLRKHGVELVVAGHVHWAFFDRLDETRCLVAPSTSFTRPGFSHMFASGPPPEQGRDDAAKLGFCLFRVMPQRTDVHFLRTGGATELTNDGELRNGGELKNDNGLEDCNTQRRRLITRVSAGTALGRVGVTLRHPLSTATDVPMAWPSAVRQKVRNDYPLLACLELGARWVRTPLADLDDAFLSRRLAILRDEGVGVVATALWSDDLDTSYRLDEHLKQVDLLELQLAGAPWPSPVQLRRLREHREAGAAVCLSTVIPGEVFAGKQHPRTRHGFRKEELAELNDRLSQSQTSVDRVLCRLDNEPGPFACVQAIRELGSLSHIGAIDLSLELTTLDDQVAALRAAEALLASSTLEESRLYFDPLIDLDRTMDVCHGLLDTRCNPRPVFHVVRCLNTILAATAEASGEPCARSMGRSIDELAVVLTVCYGKAVLCLVVPREGPSGETSLAPTTARATSLVAPTQLPQGVRWERLYTLVEGDVEEATPAALERSRRATPADGPLLLVGQR